MLTKLKDLRINSFVIIKKPVNCLTKESEKSHKILMQESSRIVMLQVFVVMLLLQTCSSPLFLVRKHHE